MNDGYVLLALRVAGLKPVEITECDSAVTAGRQLDEMQAATNGDFGLLRAGSVVGECYPWRESPADKLVASFWVMVYFAQRFDLGPQDLRDVGSRPGKRFLDALRPRHTDDC